MSPFPKGVIFLDKQPTTPRNATKTRKKGKSVESLRAFFIEKSAALFDFFDLL